MINFNDPIQSMKKRIILGEISNDDVLKSHLQQIQVLESEIRAYTARTHVQEGTLRMEPRETGGKEWEPSFLAGIPYAVQDTLCVRDLPLTCSSKIMAGFIPGFDATVVTRVQTQGGILTGKLNSNEFGIGASSANSIHPATINPWTLGSENHCTSGAAAAVAAGMVGFALGTDIAGEIRVDAADCGLAALKPTYPTVSKHGVVAVVPSMEQVGITARHLRDCQDVWQVLLGADPLDSTVLTHQEPLGYSDRDLSSLKIGIPVSYLRSAAKSAQDAVQKTADRLMQAGAKVEECGLENLQEGLMASYVLACAEISSSLSRYDGVRYGYRSRNSSDALSMYLNTRREGLTESTRQMILAGTHFLSVEGHEKYYLQAARLRTKISQNFQEILNSYDCLLTPVSAGDPAVHDDFNGMWPACANLAGLPALTFPGQLISGKPVGVQLIGKAFSESLLFAVAEKGCDQIDWDQSLRQLRSQRREER